jgi:hypothetical protein
MKAMAYPNVIGFQLLRTAEVDAPAETHIERLRAKARRAAADVGKPAPKHTREEILALLEERSRSS